MGAISILVPEIIKITSRVETISILCSKKIAQARVKGRGTITLTMKIVNNKLLTLKMMIICGEIYLTEKTWNSQR